MNKKKFSKNIIWAGIFAVFFGAGFIGVRFLKNKQTSNLTENPIDYDVLSASVNPDNIPQSYISEDSGESPSGIIVEEKNQRRKNSPENTNIQTLDVQEPKVIIGATKPKLDGERYSFVATVKNPPQDEVFTYELWSSQGVKVQSSKTGVFSDVPGVSGGKYTLWLVDSKNNRITSIPVRGFIIPNNDQNKSSIVTDYPKQEMDQSEKPKKMLITKDDFQSRLLNENDMSLKMARKASDRESLLSSNFKIAVIDMKSDENNIPSDIEGIREKIHFNIWKSATVIDISYDDVTGQVTKAVLRPVY